MTITVGMITFDSAEPGPLATWWAEQTGGRIEADNDGWFYLVGIPDTPFKLAFQKVEDPTPGKNRIHLDMSAPDLDAEVERLVAAGAAEYERHDMDGFRWVTLTDPDGNRFCVAAQPH